MVPFWKRKAKTPPQRPEPPRQPWQLRMDELDVQIDALRERMAVEYDNDQLSIEHGILCRDRDLLQWRNSGVVAGYQTLAGDDSCPACKKLAKRIFLVDEPCPLPCPDCTHAYGFCRCSMVAILDIDMPKRRKS